MFEADRLTVVGGDIGSGPVPLVYSARREANGSLGEWEPSIVLPQPIADAGLARSHRFVYLVGGTTGRVVLRTVYRATLDDSGKTGEWQSLSELLPAPRRGARAYVVGADLIVAGGEDDSGRATSTVWGASIQQDGSLAAWRSRESLIEPVARAALIATATWALLVGGENGPALTSVILAGPDGRWTAQTRLPEASGRAAGANVGDAVIIVGGSRDSPIDGAWRSRISDEGRMLSWAPIARLPQPLAGASALAAGGDLYLLGGYNGVRYQSTVYRLRLADSPRSGPSVAGVESATDGAVDRYSDLPLVPGVATVALSALLVAIVLLVRERFSS